MPLVSHGGLSSSSSSSSSTSQIPATVLHRAATSPSSSTPSPPSSSSSPLWAKIISGSLGSMATALAVTPLEVVKVRQQAATNSWSSVGSPPVPTTASSVKNSCRQVTTEQGTFVLHNGLCECVLPKCSVPYFEHPSMVQKQQPRQHHHQQQVSSMGTFGMMRRILQTEGWRGLYAGLQPTLIMGIPNTVFYFVTYEELSKQLQKHQHVLLSPLLIPPIAGGMARLLVSGITAPLELVRTRQASQVAKDYGTSSSASTTKIPRMTLRQEFQAIVRSEGITALYKGLSPTLLRDVPFSAIYWYWLEQLRTMWKQQQQQQQYPDSDTTSIWIQGGQELVNGSIAGMIAAACTTPMDVIKTRRQVVVKQQHGQLFVQESATMYQMTKEILAQEGIGGLWKGNTTRMLKIAPACAIMISSYEIGKRMLQSA